MTGAGAKLRHLLAAVILTAGVAAPSFANDYADRRLAFIEKLARQEWESGRSGPEAQRRVSRFYVRDGRIYSNLNGEERLWIDLQKPLERTVFYENGLKVISSTGTVYYYVDADGVLWNVFRLATEYKSMPTFPAGSARAAAGYQFETDALSRVRYNKLENNPETLLGRELGTIYPGAPKPDVPNPNAFADKVPAAPPKAVAVAARPALPTNRHALIIGNAAYAATFGRLANPVNDANAVAAALRKSGFTVTLVTDTDQRTMKRAIAAFGQRLAAAGKGVTGLFYYAGHGVQARGTNYLVPVNAVIDSEADVDIEAVAADAVLRQMEEAGAATSIVILDACRNLPIARGSRDGSRGLARMEAPNGSFVAYSTAPGSTAADGSGTNSPFANALVAEMAKPGQQIEITFKNVRRAVMQATGGKQTPWDSSSLVDSFVFVP